MPSLVLAVLLATADAGAAAPAPAHAHPDHAAAVDGRGDEGMGFSHQRTTHHFLLTADGGLISAEARDPSDTASRDAIRGHFAHIAQAFAAGDFALPMFIHDRTPPGADTMRRLRDRISYQVEPTAAGARVHIRTTDAEALRAVHEFLRFQISDHRTGDSPEVQR